METLKVMGMACNYSDFVIKSKEILPLSLFFTLTRIHVSDVDADGWEDELRECLKYNLSRLNYFKHFHNKLVGDDFREDRFLYVNYLMASHRTFFHEDIDLKFFCKWYWRHFNEKDNSSIEEFVKFFKELVDGYMGDEITPPVDKENVTTGKVTPFISSSEFSDQIKPNFIKLVSGSVSLACFFRHECLQRNLRLRDGSLSRRVRLYDKEMGFHLESAKFCEVIGNDIMYIYEKINNLYGDLFNDRKLTLGEISRFESEVEGLAIAISRFMKLARKKTKADLTDCDFLGRSLNVLISINMNNLSRSKLIKKFLDGKKYSEDRKGLIIKHFERSGLSCMRDEISENGNRVLIKTLLFIPYSISSMSKLQCSTSDINENYINFVRNFNSLSCFMLIPAMFKLTTLINLDNGEVRNELYLLRFGRGKLGRRVDEIEFDMYRKCYDTGQDYNVNVLETPFQYHCMSDSGEFCLGDFKYYKSKGFCKDHLDVVLRGVIPYLSNNVYSDMIYTYENRISNFIEAYPYYPRDSYPYFNMHDLFSMYAIVGYSYERETRFKLSYEGFFEEIGGNPVYYPGWSEIDPQDEDEDEEYINSDMDEDEAEDEDEDDDGETIVHL